MARFDSKSRYARDASTYEATDRRGRAVAALSVPERRAQPILGEHLRKQGQRLDHLAGFYLQDPSGYWRLCEINDAMLPDALAEVASLKIPGRS